MDTYNFWQDFFDTYQSLSDWMKVLWLMVPPVFILGLAALLARPRTGSPRRERNPHGELVYSIYRDADDRLHVISYLPRPNGQPGLILLDALNPDPHAPQNQTRRT